MPFTKIYRWRPNHWLFEKYNDNGTTYKLDVHFHLNGSARIDFWNPGQPEENQKINTSNKLSSIGLITEFEFGGFGGGMYKVFSLEKHNDIRTIDNELYSFVKRLFVKLR